MRGIFFFWHDRPIFLMSWSCYFMKDLFDTATGDMSLAVEEKKRGRPGKRVTDDNFYDVLRYFEKQPHIPARKEEEIKRISWKAPSEYQTRRYREEQLAVVRRQLKEMEAYYSAKAGDYALNKDLMNAFKNQMESRINGLKQSEKSLMEQAGVELGDWIERLQAWVDEWVENKDWKRCLNLAARRRADKKVRKKELSISAKVYEELRVVKDSLKHEITWDDFLLETLKAYKANKLK